jgi:hypothetical protein
MARSSYPESVVPRTFSSWVTKKSTTERVRDWRTGHARRRIVNCWDVQGRADGVLRANGSGAPAWQGLGRIGWTPAMPRLPFDLRTKQFVIPPGGRLG